MYNRSPAKRGCTKSTFMKPLHNLNNVEKGKLLAGLFPQELQGILNSLTQACQFLSDNEEEIREA